MGLEYDAMTRRNDPKRNVIERVMSTGVVVVLKQGGGSKPVMLGTTTARRPAWVPNAPVSICLAASMPSRGVNCKKARHSGLKMLLRVAKGWALSIRSSNLAEKKRPPLGFVIVSTCIANRLLPTPEMKDSEEGAFRDFITPSESGLGDALTSVSGDSHGNTFSAQMTLIRMIKPPQFFLATVQLVTCAKHR